MTSSPDGFSTWATFPGWPNLSELTEISRQWNMKSASQPRVNLDDFPYLCPDRCPLFLENSTRSLGGCAADPGTWRSGVQVRQFGWTSREIIPSQDPSIPPSQTPILPRDESLSRGISLPSWWQEPRMTDGRTGNVWIQGHGPAPPTTFRVKRWIFKSWTNLRRQRVFNQHRIKRIGFGSNPWAAWKCQLNLIRVFILLNQPSRACVAFCGTLPAAWEQTHNKLSQIPLELLTKV